MTAPEGHAVRFHGVGPWAEQTIAPDDFRARRLTVVRRSLPVRKERLAELWSNSLWSSVVTLARRSPLLPSQDGSADYHGSCLAMREDP